MNDILPCKFCGKFPRIDQRENSTMLFCKCSDLPVYSLYQTEEIAIDMWNKTYGKAPSGE